LAFQSPVNDFFATAGHVDSGLSMLPSPFPDIAIDAEVNHLASQIGAVAAAGPSSSSANVVPFSGGHCFSPLFRDDDPADEKVGAFFLAPPVPAHIGGASH